MKKKSLLLEKINEINKTLARQMKFFIKEDKITNAGNVKYSINTEQQTLKG